MLYCYKKISQRKQLETSSLEIKKGNIKSVLEAQDEFCFNFIIITLKTYFRPTSSKTFNVSSAVFSQ